MTTQQKEHKAPMNGMSPHIMPVFEFWMEAARCATDHSQKLFAAIAEARDIETMRKRFLDALSESLDSYMRSPIFLEMMRRNFEMLMQIQNNMEDRARDIARVTGVPRIDDISGLFERMRINDDQIQAQLNRIESRLQAIETKVASR